MRAGEVGADTNGAPSPAEGNGARPASDALDACGDGAAEEFEAAGADCVGLASVVLRLPNTN